MNLTEFQKLQKELDNFKKDFIAEKEKEYEKFKKLFSKLSLEELKDSKYTFEQTLTSSDLSDCNTSQIQNAKKSLIERIKTSEEPYKLLEDPKLVITTCYDYNDVAYQGIVLETKVLYLINKQELEKIIESMLNGKEE